MALYSGVSEIICAAHESLDGRLHGHTWEVIAWWRNDSFLIDADNRKKELKNFLSQFDHTKLLDCFAWGERLAEHIGIHMKCDIIEVNRKLEGIYARWERDA